MSQQLSLPDRGGAPPADEGSVFFVGTATVVLRYGGFTLLTDPNFLHKGDHVHLGYGLTSRRLTEPALEIDALPPIDLVLLSHLHEDHFDRVVEEKLDHTLPIVTTPEAAARLRAKGFVEARGLVTWEALTVRKGSSTLRITAMPGRHGPGFVDWLLPDVMGSMLDFESAGASPGLRLYISGDTLLVAELHEIPRRYPDIDLALLHLGGTRVLGVLVTMDARQGVGALRLIAPRMAVPIHYDDYTVFKSPLDEFTAAVREAGLDGHVTYLARGDSYFFRPAELRRMPRLEPSEPLPASARRRFWSMAGGAAALAVAWVFFRSARRRRTPPGLAPIQPKGAAS